MLLFQLKNYKCGECGYTCYLKTDLERHIMNVHDKIRSPCPACGKKYSDLRQHIRVVHEGAKVTRLVSKAQSDLNVVFLNSIFIFQAECPHCKGRYTNLSQHINKVHLKTKNVICEHCGSAFYHASHLKRHRESVHIFLV